MNCWEAVLYSAWRFGVLDKAKINEYIKQVENITVMGPGSAPVFVKKIVSSPMGQINNFQGSDIDISHISIPAGYIVVFGEDGQHVAISTGEITEEGHRIIELDSDSGGIAFSTVEATMFKKAPYRRQLSWAPFPM